MRTLYNDNSFVPDSCMRCERCHSSHLLKILMGSGTQLALLRMHLPGSRGITDMCSLIYNLLETHWSANFPSLNRDQIRTVAYNTWQLRLININGNSFKRNAQFLAISSKMEMFSNLRVFRMNFARDLFYKRLFGIFQKAE